MSMVRNRKITRNRDEALVLALDLGFLMAVMTTVISKTNLILPRRIAALVYDDKAISKYSERIFENCWY